MDHDEEKSLSLGTEMSASVPPPSPLTGCYLLAVIGEPHTNEHKEIILQRLVKGLLSWDSNEHLVDLERELATLTQQAPEGEDARNGERLIQFASENLVTEILIHPQMNTLMQCMRNLLSSFTRHRHLVHAGYTFAGSGSWIMQDGTFSLADFTDAYQENEVQRVIRAYENSISIDIHCATNGGGEWEKLPDMPFVKHCKIQINPTDILDSGSQAIKDFVSYLEPYVAPASLDQLLVSSDVVGNIRFSHPTLYVFPGGQGDAALFGISGFNMLVDGGFSRKACWWDFARHLDRLDAVLFTRLNNCSACGMAAVLKRKAGAQVYPQIGHFFCNLEDRSSSSPDLDKDSDPLLVSLHQVGGDMTADLRRLKLKPQHCYSSPTPINLYHKVGHGTLDMYVLNPSKDSKHVREFLKQWQCSEQKLFEGASVSGQFNFPIPNLVSICALLVWRPANPDDTITRIMFPGSTPQHKIFEGLEKLKNLEFLQHPTCTGRQIASVSTPTTTINTLSTKTTKLHSSRVIKEKHNVLNDGTKDEKLVEPEPLPMKVISTKGETVSKNFIDNKLLSDLVDGEDKQLESVLQEALIARSNTKLDSKFESVTSDFVTTNKDTKKKGKNIDKKSKLIDKTNTNKDFSSNVKMTESTKGENDFKIKSDIRKKNEVKTKAEPTLLIKNKTQNRTVQKVLEKKNITGNDKRSTNDDKKSSPTTPKKTTDIKSLATNEQSKIKSKTKKLSPSSTPAKSTKEANNRRVVESKYKQISPKRDINTKTVEKKDARVKRESISRRPRPLSSPVKSAKAFKSPSKPQKVAKTENSKLKGLQRVNYEDVLKEAKKSDEETSKSIDDIKQQEIDEREEQEIVREIEAVFNRDNEGEEKHDFVGRSDIEKITCLLNSAKQTLAADGEFEEEYLIIEKEEIEPYHELNNKDDQELGGDSQKHIKEKEESEKVNNAAQFESDQKKKDEVILEDSKEHSLSVEEKQDISSEKKTSDSKNDIQRPKDSLELNMIQESQPDEKISTTLESGATTAPTLPEDERIIVDEIKQTQNVEEKSKKELIKKILPPQTLGDNQKPVAEIPIKIKSQASAVIRDVVKTPDEVADLPLHEVVDYNTFEERRSVETGIYKNNNFSKSKDKKVPDNLPLHESATTSIKAALVSGDVIVTTLEQPSHAELVNVTPGSAPDSPLYPESNKINTGLSKELDTVKEFEDENLIFNQYTEKLRETHITTLDSPIKDEIISIVDIPCMPEKIPSIPEDVEKEIEESENLDVQNKVPLSPKEVEKIVANVAEVLKSEKTLDELISEKSTILPDLSSQQEPTNSHYSVGAQIEGNNEIDAETPAHDNYILTLDSAKTLEKLEEKMADLKKKEQAISQRILFDKTEVLDKTTKTKEQLNTDITNKLGISEKPSVIKNFDAFGIESESLEEALDATEKYEKEKSEKITSFDNTKLTNTKENQLTPTIEDEKSAHSDDKIFKNLHLEECNLTKKQPTELMALGDLKLEREKSFNEKDDEVKKNKTPSEEVSLKPYGLPNNDGLAKDCAEEKIAKHQLEEIVDVCKDDAMLQTLSATLEKEILSNKEDKINDNKSDTSHVKQISGIRHDSPIPEGDVALTIDEENKSEKVKAKHKLDESMDVCKDDTRQQSPIATLEKERFSNEGDKINDKESDTSPLEQISGIHPGSPRRHEGDSGLTIDEEDKTEKLIPKHQLEENIDVSKGETMLQSPSATSENQQFSNKEEQNDEIKSDTTLLDQISEIRPGSPTRHEGDVALTIDDEDNTEKAIAKHKLDEGIDVFKDDTKLQTPIASLDKERFSNKEDKINDKKSETSPLEPISEKRHDSPTTEGDVALTIDEEDKSEKVIPKHELKENIDVSKDETMLKSPSATSENQHFSNKEYQLDEKKSDTTPIEQISGIHPGSPTLHKGDSGVTIDDEDKSEKLIPKHQLEENIDVCKEETMLQSPCATSENQPFSNKEDQKYEIKSDPILLEQISEIRPGSPTRHEGDVALTIDEKHKSEKVIAKHKLDESIDVCKYETKLQSPIATLEKERFSNEEDKINDKKCDTLPLEQISGIRPDLPTRHECDSDLTIDEEDKSEKVIPKHQLEENIDVCKDETMLKSPSATSENQPFSNKEDQKDEIKSDPLLLEQKSGIRPDSPTRHKGDSDFTIDEEDKSEKVIPKHQLEENIDVCKDETMLKSPSATSENQKFSNKEYQIDEKKSDTTPIEQKSEIRPGSPTRHEGDVALTNDEEDKSEKLIAKHKLDESIDVCEDHTKLQSPIATLEKERFSNAEDKINVKKSDISPLEQISGIHPASPTRHECDSDLTINEEDKSEKVIAKHKLDETIDVCKDDTKLQSPIATLEKERFSNEEDKINDKKSDISPLEQISGIQPASPTRHECDSDLTIDEEDKSEKVIPKHQLEENIDVCKDETMLKSHSATSENQQFSNKEDQIDEKKSDTTPIEQISRIHPGSPTRHKGDSGVTIDDEDKSEKLIPKQQLEENIDVCKEETMLQSPSATSENQPFSNKEDQKDEIKSDPILLEQKSEIRPGSPTRHKGDVALTIDEENKSEKVIAKHKLDERIDVCEYDTKLQSPIATLEKERFSNEKDKINDKKSDILPLEQISEIHPGLPTRHKGDSGVTIDEEDKSEKVIPKHQLEENIDVCNDKTMLKSPSATSENQPFSNKEDQKDEIKSDPLLLEKKSEIRPGSPTRHKGDVALTIDEENKTEKAKAKHKLDESIDVCEYDTKLQSAIATLEKERFSNEKDKINDKKSDILPLEQISETHPGSPTRHKGDSGVTIDEEDKSEKVIPKHQLEENIDVCKDKTMLKSPSATSENQPFSNKEDQKAEIKSDPLLLEQKSEIRPGLPTRHEGDVALTNDEEDKSEKLIAKHKLDESIDVCEDHTKLQSPIATLEKERFSNAEDKINDKKSDTSPLEQISGIHPGSPTRHEGDSDLTTDEEDKSEKVIAKHKLDETIDVCKDDTKLQSPIATLEKERFSNEEDKINDKKSDISPLEQISGIHPASPTRHECDSDLTIDEEDKSEKVIPKHQLEENIDVCKDKTMLKSPSATSENQPFSNKEDQKAEIKSDPLLLEQKSEIRPGSPTRHEGDVALTNDEEDKSEKLIAKHKLDESIDVCEDHTKLQSPIATLEKERFSNAEDKINDKKSDTSPLEQISGIHPGSPTRHEGDSDLTTDEEDKSEKVIAKHKLDETIDVCKDDTKLQSPIATLEKERFSNEEDKINDKKSDISPLEQISGIHPASPTRHECDSDLTIDEEDKSEKVIPKHQLEENIDVCQDETMLQSPSATPENQPFSNKKDQKDKIKSDTTLLEQKSEIRPGSPTRHKGDVALTIDEENKTEKAKAKHKLDESIDVCKDNTKLQSPIASLEKEILLNEENKINDKQSDTSPLEQISGIRPGSPTRLEGEKIAYDDGLAKVCAENVIEKQQLEVNVNLSKEDTVLQSPSAILEKERFLNEDVKINDKKYDTSPEEHISGDKNHKSDNEKNINDDGLAMVCTEKLKANNHLEENVDVCKEETIQLSLSTTLEKEIFSNEKEKINDKKSDTSSVKQSEIFSNEKERLNDKISDPSSVKQIAVGSPTRHEGDITLTIDANDKSEKVITKHQLEENVNEENKINDKISDTLPSEQISEMCLGSPTRHEGNVALTINENDKSDTEKITNDDSLAKGAAIEVIEKHQLEENVDVCKDNAMQQSPSTTLEKKRISNEESDDSPVVEEKRQELLTRHEGDVAITIDGDDKSDIEKITNDDGVAKICAEKVITKHQLEENVHICKDDTMLRSPSATLEKDRFLNQDDQINKKKQDILPLEKISEKHPDSQSRHEGDVALTIDDNDKSNYEKNTNDESLVKVCAKEVTAKLQLEENVDVCKDDAMQQLGDSATSKKERSSIEEDKINETKSDTSPEKLLSGITHGSLTQLKDDVALALDKDDKSDNEKTTHSDGLAKVCAEKVITKHQLEENVDVRKEDAMQPSPSATIKKEISSNEEDEIIDTKYDVSPEEPISGITHDSQTQLKDDVALALDKDDKSDNDKTTHSDGLAKVCAEKVIKKHQLEENVHVYTDDTMSDTLPLEHISGKLDGSPTRNEGDVALTIDEINKFDNEKNTNDESLAKVCAQEVTTKLQLEENVDVCKDDAMQQLPSATLKKEISSNDVDEIIDTKSVASPEEQISGITHDSQTQLKGDFALALDKYDKSDNDKTTHSDNLAKVCAAKVITKYQLEENAHVCTDDSMSDTSPLEHISGKRDGSPTRHEGDVALTVDENDKSDNGKNTNDESLAKVCAQEVTAKLQLEENIDVCKDDAMQQSPSATLKKEISSYEVDEIIDTKSVVSPEEQISGITHDSQTQFKGDVALALDKYDKSDNDKTTHSDDLAKVCAAKVIIKYQLEENAHVCTDDTMSDTSPLEHISGKRDGSPTRHEGDVALTIDENDKSDNEKNTNDDSLAKVCAQEVTAKLQLEENIDVCKDDAMQQSPSATLKKEISSYEVDEIIDTKSVVSPEEQISGITHDSQTELKDDVALALDKDDKFDNDKTTHSDGLAKVCAEKVITKHQLEENEHVCTDDTMSDISPLEHISGKLDGSPIRHENNVTLTIDEDDKSYTENITNVDSLTKVRAEEVKAKQQLDENVNVCKKDALLQSPSAISEKERFSNEEDEINENQSDTSHEGQISDKHHDSPTKDEGDVALTINAGDKSQMVLAKQQLKVKNDFCKDDTMLQSPIATLKKKSLSNEEDKTNDKKSETSPLEQLSEIRPGSPIRHEGDAGFTLNEDDKSDIEKITKDDGLAKVCAEKVITKHQLKDNVDDCKDNTSLQSPSAALKKERFSSEKDKINDTKSETSPVEQISRIQYDSPTHESDVALITEEDNKSEKLTTKHQLEENVDACKENTMLSSPSLTLEKERFSNEKDKISQTKSDTLPVDQISGIRHDSPTHEGDVALTIDEDDKSEKAIEKHQLEASTDICKNDTMLQSPTKTWEKERLSNENDKINDKKSETSPLEQISKISLGSPKSHEGDALTLDEDDKSDDEKITYVDGLAKVCSEKVITKNKLEENVDVCKDGTMLQSPSATLEIERFPNQEDKINDQKHQVEENVDVCKNDTMLQSPSATFKKEKNSNVEDKINDYKYNNSPLGQISGKLHDLPTRHEGDVKTDLEVNTKEKNVSESSTDFFSEKRPLDETVEVNDSEKKLKSPSDVLLENNKFSNKDIDIKSETTPDGQISEKHHDFHDLLTRHEIDATLTKNKDHEFDQTGMTNDNNIANLSTEKVLEKQRLNESFGVCEKNEKVKSSSDDLLAESAAEKALEKILLPENVEVCEKDKTMNIKVESYNLSNEEDKITHTKSVTTSDGPASGVLPDLQTGLDSNVTVSKDCSLIEHGIKKDDDSANVLIASEIEKHSLEDTSEVCEHKKEIKSPSDISLENNRLRNEEDKTYVSKTDTLSDDQIHVKCHGLLLEQEGNIVTTKHTVDLLNKKGTIKDDNFGKFSVKNALEKHHFEENTEIHEDDMTIDEDKVDDSKFEIIQEDLISEKHHDASTTQGNVAAKIDEGDAKKDKFIKINHETEILENQRLKEEETRENMKSPSDKIEENDESTNKKDQSKEFKKCISEKPDLPTKSESGISSIEAEEKIDITEIPKDDINAESIIVRSLEKYPLEENIIDVKIKIPNLETEENNILNEEVKNQIKKSVTSEVRISDEPRDLFINDDAIVTTDKEDELPERDITKNDNISVTSTEGSLEKQALEEEPVICEKNIKTKFPRFEKDENYKFLNNEGKLYDIKPETPTISRLLTQNKGDVATTIQECNKPVRKESIKDENIVKHPAENALEKEAFKDDDELCKDEKIIKTPIDEMTNEKVETNYIKCVTSAEEHISEKPHDLPQKQEVLSAASIVKTNESSKKEITTKDVSIAKLTAENLLEKQHSEEIISENQHDLTKLEDDVAPIIDKCDELRIKKKEFEASNIKSEITAGEQYSEKPLDLQTQEKGHLAANIVKDNEFVQKETTNEIDHTKTLAEKSLEKQDPEENVDKAKKVKSLSIEREENNEKELKDNTIVETLTEVHMSGKYDELPTHHDDDVAVTVDKPNQEEITKDNNNAKLPTEKQLLDQSVEVVKDDKITKSAIEKHVFDEIVKTGTDDKTFRTTIDVTKNTDLDSLTPFDNLAQRDNNLSLSIFNESLEDVSKDISLEEKHSNEKSEKGIQNIDDAKINQTEAVFTSDAENKKTSIAICETTDSGLSSISTIAEDVKNVEDSNSIQPVINETMFFDIKNNREFETEYVQQGIKSEDIYVFSDCTGSKRSATPPTVPVSPLPKTPISLHDDKICEVVHSGSLEKLDGFDETVTKVVHVGDDILTQKISTSTEKSSKSKSNLSQVNEDNAYFSVMESVGKIQTETDTITKIIKEGENVVTQTITTVVTKEILSGDDGTPQNIKTTIETTTLSKSSDGATTETKDTQTLLTECSSSLKSISAMDLHTFDEKINKDNDHQELSKNETKQSEVFKFSDSTFGSQDTIKYVTETDDDENVEDTTIDSDVTKRIVKEDGVDVIETVTTITKKETIKINESKRILRLTIETNTVKEKPDGSKCAQKSVEIKTEEMVLNSSNDIEEILENFIVLDSPEETISPKVEEVIENGIKIKRLITTKITKITYADIHNTPQKLKTVITTTTTDNYPDGSSQTRVETSTSICDIIKDKAIENVELEYFTILEDKSTEKDIKENNVIINGKDVQQLITTTTTKEILANQKDNTNKKIKTTTETITESVLPDGITEVTKELNVSISDYSEDSFDKDLENFEAKEPPVQQTSTTSELIEENGQNIKRMTTIITTTQTYNSKSDDSIKIKTTVSNITEDTYPDGSVIKKESNQQSIKTDFNKPSPKQSDHLVETVQCEHINLEKSRTPSLSEESVEGCSENSYVKNEIIEIGETNVKRSVTTNIKTETLKNNTDVKRIRTTTNIITDDEYPDGTIKTTKEVKVSVSEVQQMPDATLLETLKGLESTGKIEKSDDKQKRMVLINGEEITQNINTYVTKEELIDKHSNQKAVRTITKVVTENIKKDGSVETTTDVQTQISYLTQEENKKEPPKQSQLNLPLKQNLNLNKTEKKSSPVGNVTTETETFTKVLNEGNNEITQTITVITTKEIITPEKVKITVETTTVSKNNDGSTKTSKSTKTTISEIKEEFEESFDAFTNLNEITQEETNNLTEPENTGVCYSDEDGAISPSSTKSQSAHSPRSNLSFELETVKSDEHIDNELNTLNSNKNILPTSFIENVVKEKSNQNESKLELLITEKFLKHEQSASENYSSNIDTTFLKEADEHFEKAIAEHKKVSGENVISNITAKYELSENLTHSQQTSDEKIHLKEAKKPLSNVDESKVEESSEPKPCQSKDPIASWGKPLGLPSPVAPPNQSDGKNTPKKQAPSSTVLNKNKINQERSKESKSKASESPSKKKSIAPIYLELTYVPHHGNSYYSAMEFFKRVRARYYVFSGTEPSKEIYNALLDAKKTWDDKSLEVTIIPTYDTDVLGYWVTENEEALEKYKIDLSPSASRCTINLQDHETSCAAYRLEF